MAKGGSSPAAPDYTTAAKETAKGNLQMAQYTTAANRVNQSNPFGSIQFTKSMNGGGFDQSAYDKAIQAWKQSQTINPSGGQINMGGTNMPTREQFTTPGEEVWSAETKLSPEQQQLLDYQTQSSLGLGGIQSQLAGRAGEMLGTEFDQSQLPAQQINPGQTAQDAIMARLNPQFDRQASQLETKLANQGIAPGTEAWKNAQADLSMARNDAMSQAALQGIGVGQQARQQALGEQQLFRNMPLQELSAIRGLTAPNMPTFGGVPQQGQVQGADVLGAQNAQYGAQMGGYNAQQAQNSNFNSGLMNTALMASMYFSDRRLKTNIEHIGKTPSGLNIYKYDYVWGEPSVGVMADEVEKVYPEAVSVHYSGYKMVDYSKVR